MSYNCIGIIGAMEEEVAQLKEMMTEVTIIKKAGMAFNQGLLQGKKVVVVRSGVGKVNAAACTQILVDLFQVDAIINTGIAGSLKAEIDIGDIVISTDVLHHDVYACYFGYEPGEVPQLGRLSFPADETLGDLCEKICREVNPEINTYRGRVVSGDQFVASDPEKKRIIDQFHGYCTEMEGAAIGQTAWLNEIPFIILRAISDKADNSATMDYPTFEKRAIAHCVNLTVGLVKSL